MDGVRLLAIGAATVALAGCAGGSPGHRAFAGNGPSTTGGVTAPSASSAPSLGADGRPLPTRPDCAAGAGGRFVVERTAGGGGVGVLVLGTGSAGVVLAPQSDGGICQWLPYGRELARRYRVAMFDWSTAREESEPLAVRAVRDLGARRVVLAGASLGGALALATAHRIRPRLAGVVSFSGELTLRSDFDAKPGLARWHGPLLLLGSRGDGFFTAADARLAARVHPGPETVVTVPGNAHGVDLLEDPAAVRVRAAVSRFLTRTLGARAG